MTINFCIERRPRFITLRFQTWVYAAGGSWGELPWSQGPSKRLLLSVVLSNSLDEVTSMSFTVGSWSWTSLKFFALVSSALVRRFAAYVVCLLIAWCAYFMLRSSSRLGVGVFT